MVFPVRLPLARKHSFHRLFFKKGTGARSRGWINDYGICSLWLGEEAEMEFEWSAEKAKINLKKHNVSFPEAGTIFNDPLSLTFPDPDHSIEESRYIIIGMSRLEKVLVVAHTDRRTNIRIISARKATPKERRFYEQGTE